MTNPASCSLVSANGPSTTCRVPFSTRSVVAVSGGAARCRRSLPRIVPVRQYRPASHSNRLRPARDHWAWPFPPGSHGTAACIASTLPFFSGWPSPDGLIKVASVFTCAHHYVRRSQRISTGRGCRIPALIHLTTSLLAGNSLPVSLVNLCELVTRCHLNILREARIDSACRKPRAPRGVASRRASSIRRRAAAGSGGFRPTRQSRRVPARPSRGLRQDRARQG
jgi:hypothetical protein